MYTKNFDIRWSDLDANKHLGNSSYVDFMSHTRMAFFMEQGLDLETMSKYGLGPVVFYEHLYFFREILLGAHVTVSLEIDGFSEDGRFVKIAHNFYDENGKNMAYAEMLFSWIDLKSRKLGKVPDEIRQIISKFPRSKNFRILTKSDTRIKGIRPVDLEK